MGADFGFGEEDRGRPVQVHTPPPCVTDFEAPRGESDFYKLATCLPPPTPHPSLASCCSW